MVHFKEKLLGSGNLEKKKEYGMSLARKKEELGN